MSQVHVTKLSCNFELNILKIKDTSVKKDNTLIFIEFFFFCEHSSSIIVPFLKKFTAHSFKNRIMMVLYF